jgi:hypothetical protein
MTSLKDLEAIFKARKQSFQLQYDVDYGISRRSGWSVVINGSVIVQFADGPEAALKEALDRVRHWESDEATRANLEEIRTIVENNPCHHRVEQADCVLCDIRKVAGERESQGKKG